ncbi:MAG: hypothetical protein PGMFKBFP_02945 [Anaerolineales bacterium]|nr:hypothetical protein [Anaerolineales bacterium]
MTVANNFVEDAFLRHEVALLFDHKRTGLPEFDRVAYLCASFIQNGQFVDLLLESFDDRFRGFEFGKVANRVRVVQFNGGSKKTIGDKFLHFAVKNVIPADKTQVFHNRLGEVTDHTAIIGDGGRVQMGDVINFALCNILEDDLAHFGFGKLFIVNFLMTKGSKVKVFKPFVFAENARGENGNFNVEFVNILFDVFVIHFNNNGRVRGCACSHRLSLQYHAFAFDGFDKIHKRFCANHADIFGSVCARASVHAAQTAP